MGSCCPSLSRDKEEESQDETGSKTLDESLIPSTESDKKIGFKDFKVLKLLGQGSFGKVYLVHRNEKYYAMKVLNKKDAQKKKQKFHNQLEREILSSMECPFVVSLYYAFQTSQKLYMVMDFMAGGELFTHLRIAGRFSEARVVFYAAELLLALEYLHGKGIIYRDLKPENVLIDKDGHLRITDFGLSKQGIYDGDYATSICGTPEYIAPEVLLQKGYDKAADFWSYGILIYEMLSGVVPFRGERNEMFRKIAFPEERLNTAQKIKEHEFFRGIDWEMVHRREIKPPFKPRLKNDMDLRFFDKTFTEKAIQESMNESHIVANSTYAGFSYQKSLADGIKKMLEKNPDQPNELIEVNPDFDSNLRRVDSLLIRNYTQESINDPINSGLVPDKAHQLVL